MIISRTPFRISLFGGGTDYPDWIRQHGGAVVGMSINKYCYISIRTLPPFFEHKHRIVYSKIELVRKIDEIVHPAVRSVLAEYPPNEGLEIHHDADLPARSGMGSSSSFTVGLLKAITEKYDDVLSKEELSHEAIRIEQEVIRENVGCQDQVWAVYGGLNRIDFEKDGRFKVSPIELPAGRVGDLMGSMLLFFTGFSRYASDIAKEQIENMASHQSQLKSIREIAEEAFVRLQDPKETILSLGELLNDSWKMKRELAQSVSTSEIDEIYEAGMEAGAVGGKLLGAGGGGFILFMVPPPLREKVRERLSRLIHVSFDIEYEGSKIMHNEYEKTQAHIGKE